MSDTDRQKMINSIVSGDPAEWFNKMFKATLGNGKALQILGNSEMLEHITFNHEYVDIMLRLMDANLLQIVELSQAEAGSMYAVANEIGSWYDWSDFA